MNEREGDKMAFPISAGLLDAMVLAIVEKEETYGYRITQDIREAMDISESTLYPVLRRLQKDNSLEVFDKQFQGRNRRYYRITEIGKASLTLAREQWKLHKIQIEKVLFEQEKREKDERGEINE